MVDAIVKKLDKKYRSNITTNHEYMIHKICKERGWSITYFYELPLGEQESYIAFEIVENYISTVENIRNIKDSEKSSKKQKEPSKTEQETIKRQMEDMKSIHRKNKKK
jgi:hypothetical protein